MSVRVLISDNIYGEQIKTILKSKISASVHVEQITDQQLCQDIQNYDVVMIGDENQINAEMLNKAKGLKVIGRTGVGVDNIDVLAAKEKGIPVINCPTGNTTSAAELACSMILSLSRNLQLACASLKSGKWDRRSFTGIEVCGKTLAVIGLGRIGREVVTRMKAFGMRIIGYDPAVSQSTYEALGIKCVQMSEIWPEADFITLHVPLLPATRHLIDDNVLKRCKFGVKIVNVARGGCIDEHALLCHLNSGHVGGAALDVFQEEPPSDLSLIKHPNVVPTPHMGACTLDAYRKISEEMASQIASFLTK